MEMGLKGFITWVLGIGDRGWKGELKRCKVTGQNNDLIYGIYDGAKVIAGARFVKGLCRTRGVKASGLERGEGTPQTLNGNRH
jgi:hypothetical protein